MRNRQLLLSHEDLAGLDEEGAKQKLLQMGEERHAEKREGLATLNNKVRGGLSLCHVVDFLSITWWNLLSPTWRIFISVTCWILPRGGLSISTWWIFPCHVVDFHSTMWWTFFLPLGGFSLCHVVFALDRCVPLHKA
jgi:hypothetical protein